MQAKREGLVKVGHMVLMKVKLGQRASWRPILLLCWGGGGGEGGGRGEGGRRYFSPVLCLHVHAYFLKRTRRSRRRSGKPQLGRFGLVLTQKPLCPSPKPRGWVGVGVWREMGGRGGGRGEGAETQKDARGAIRETARADAGSEILRKQIA